MGEDGRLGGKLLVASPQLDDPNFVRTVVLVLEHGEPGAVGVVLNRPMHVGVEEILRPWAELAAVEPPGVLFGGGPVSPDAVIGLVLPAPGVEPSSWKAVAHGIGVVDLSVEPDDQPEPLTAARLYCGYAGWGPQQLEGEIDDDGWLILDCAPNDVFCAQPDQLWHDVLQRQGGRLAMLATYPPAPSVN